MKLTDNAIRVLEKRYLKKDAEGNPVEKPEDLFKRVAGAVARADLNYDPKADIEALEREFLDVMTNLEFLPNSPTLMNAGREMGQLSACFVLPVEDSMDSIFESLKNTALIHKSGGGTGFSFSRLRPKNDTVRSSHGVSSGPVSFMSIYDHATEQVKQGGARRGANMGILRVDHPDILEFIGCKEKDGTLSNFNISVAITDEFMEAVDKNGKYPLINPRTGERVREILARGVFDTIVDMAWKTGDPGLVFIDRINRCNPTPHVGDMEATNPCGEQPLLPYESCNLGSINLAAMVKKGEIDFERLQRVIVTAVHFLDNVIDVNSYPVQQIERMTKANRKIGLGVMGFADMLIKLGVSYSSEEAVEIAGNIMSFINTLGHKASIALGQMRGSFPNWKGSIFNDHEKMRNATVTTIAPTGTISILAGASSGIEPLFALSFARNVMDNDELVEVNPCFENMAKDRGFYSELLMKKIAAKGSVNGIREVPEEVKKVFVTAQDIPLEQHIRIQAAFQESTNNAVSKTINLPNSATREDVERAYKLSYELGCKGITVYRDGSKSRQVITTGTSAGKRQTSSPAGEAAPRPRKLSGDTYEYPVGCGKAFININCDPATGRPIEVFIRLGKSGGCLASQTEAFGRLISVSLRAGVKPEELIKQLVGIKCDQVAWIGNGEKTESCSDAIGKALREALGEEPPPIDDEYIAMEEKRGGAGFCPDCGGMLVFEEGCKRCTSPDCGYSQC